MVYNSRQAGPNITKDALVIVPSNMVDSLNPGGILGHVSQMKKADEYADSKD